MSRLRRDIKFWPKVVLFQNYALSVVVLVLWLSINPIPVFQ